MRELVVGATPAVSTYLLPLRRRDAVVPEDLLDGLLAAVPRDELER